MSLGTLTLLAAALGTDAFSLSLGLGLAGIRRKQAVSLTIVIIALHVALPIVGFWLGGIFGRIAGKWAGYVGAGILFFLGLKMIYDWFRDEPAVKLSVLAGFVGVFVLGLGVSMDALSVGFTLGVAGAQLFLTAAVIGVVAGAMTVGAFILAKWVHGRVGRHAHLAGGVALIGVGLHLLL